MFQLEVFGHPMGVTDRETMKALEQQLHDELHAVLSKAEYGVYKAVFSGSQQASDHVHIQPVNAPQPEPAAAPTETSGLPGL